MNNKFPDVVIVPADPRYPIEKHPLITNRMKADTIGEFQIELDSTCSACYFGEPEENCEVCGGEIECTRKVDVPWETCKKIYKHMARIAADEMAHITTDSKPADTGDKP